MRRSSAAFILLLALAPAAWAEDRSARIEAGHDIADRLCARCHAIGAEGDSPHEEAPPFRTFAERWPVEHLAEALAEGITVGHPDMPEFVLEPGEIDSFIAYLKSLE
ncbi:MAG: c-type cytochrome [Hyphomicrobiales bacterium]